MCLFFFVLVTYRIPLIDIDAIDLLPIHYFVDPGPDFAWPIDEELSDDKIHLYTTYGESRMETLENYLNLSKENCPLNVIIPPVPTTTTATTPSTNNNNNNNSNTQDDAPSVTDTNPPSSSTINNDVSSIETSSISTPIINKKLSRPSFNSFSKIIRRTFIEPFSSNKRASLKQHKQNLNNDTSDTSTMNETEHIRRASSPLLNRRTNMLTIIVTNFQPKRPKTSDNMIKNYIDACMNEYRLEKTRKQLNETSNNENENTSINNNNNNNINYSNWNQDLTSNVYNRYNSSSSNANRYQQNDNITSTRKVNSIANKPKSTQKTGDFDDNDDSIPMENGQFSTNVNYLQQTHRKSNHLTQVKSYFSLIFNCYLLLE